MPQPASDKVAVVVPHGGADRLQQLVATLVTLRQRPGVGEVIVVEMGAAPVAEGIAARWADKHLFIEHPDAFERARALNAGAAVAERDFVLWHDNDLLVPESVITQGVKELRERRLDFLIPYTTVRYLSQDDSEAVAQGTRNPAECRPVNTLHATGRNAACPGCLGLVRRDFVLNYGGYVEGFRGWGGEDNAWNRKVTLLGRSSATTRTDRHVYHLYHPTSGGYVQGGGSGTNPHYAKNVALLQHVWAVREAAEFVRKFPKAQPAAGKLTRSNGNPQPPDEELPVWTYWEGPCPSWIRACRQTIVAHAPRVRLLTPDRFDRVRDRDRDINVSRLDAPHRADYIRAFLLHRYGGLWVDADCLVMKSLNSVVDSLPQYPFIGHRERSGLISTAFIGARPGSRIASALYDRICQHLRAKKAVHWTSLGGEPLTALVAENPQEWHELPCERVQPVCWSHPEEFLVERGPEEHQRVFDDRAICYMLSNCSMSRYLAQNPQRQLMNERTFFSFVLRRALARHQSAGGAYERIFSSFGELYERQRSESVSGPGSSLAETQELRERLPLVLESLAIRSLLDAGCGDLNWMEHVQLGVHTYIGVDAQAEVIADDQWLHTAPHRQFQRADILRDALPRADGVLCRDVLPHLSFAEIVQAIANFKASGATYLLTTTFAGPRPNRDTAGGEWRPLNLTLPPFGFPAPLRLVNEKCSEGGGAYSDKSLGVWRFADLPL
jgi:hypothetical protein